MKKPVQDGIVQCGISYPVVSFRHRELGPDQSGFEIVAVFKDFEEILAVLGCRGRQKEVLHDPM